MTVTHTGVCGLRLLDCPSALVRGNLVIVVRVVGIGDGGWGRGRGSRDGRGGSVFSGGGYHGTRLDACGMCS